MERVVGQGFEHTPEVDGDIVPGRDLIGNLSMRAVPVGRDIGIRPGDGDQRRGGKRGAGNRVGAGEVQLGKAGVRVQKEGDVGGKRAVGAVDRQEAEAPFAGEGEVLFAGVLTEGGIGVHG